MYKYILSCSYLAISDCLSVGSDIGEAVEFIPSGETFFQTFVELSDATSCELKNKNDYFVEIEKYSSLVHCFP